MTARQVQARIQSLANAKDAAVLAWFFKTGPGQYGEGDRFLGIKVPVLAWGLGIDRMAMISMGLHDIRDLFSNTLEEVRMRRIR